MSRQSRNMRGVRYSLCPKWSSMNSSMIGNDDGWSLCLQKRVILKEIKYRIHMRCSLIFIAPPKIHFDQPWYINMLYYIQSAVVFLLVLDKSFDAYYTFVKLSCQNCFLFQNRSQNKLKIPENEGNENVAINSVLWVSKSPNERRTLHKICI